MHGDRLRFRRSILLVCCRFEIVTKTVAAHWLSLDLPLRLIGAADVVVSPPANSDRGEACCFLGMCA